MNGLFLSGERLYNKAWMERVIDQLQPLFTTAILHDYRHWAQGGAIDLPYELPRIIDEARTLDDEYVLFAKSAGSVLGMQGIVNASLKPLVCVFVGVPLKMAIHNGDILTAWSHAAHPPTLFIQNDYDPLSRAEELSDYLTRIKAANYTLQTLSGDSHSYDDLATLYRPVEEFLGSTRRVN